MRRCVIASLLVVQLSLTIGCGHSHTKPKTLPAEFAQEFASHIDKEEIDTDARVLLDLALTNTIYGESLLTHRSAFTKAWESRPSDRQLRIFFSSSRSEIAVSKSRLLIRLTVEPRGWKSSFAMTVVRLLAHACDKQNCDLVLSK